jgi:DNA repair exonuclease SbcCD ATPase subunit
MLSRMHIRGFGPHDDTVIDFSPKGLTIIEGRSQVGKSSLYRALLFCLWGVDRHGKPVQVDQIREGADACSVSVTLASGTTFTRSMTRTRTTTRQVVNEKGEAAVFPNEDSWRARLNALAKDTNVLRIVMVPLAWRDLAGAPGNGQHLRDLLVRILPGGNVRDEVAKLMSEAGFELRPDDPIEEKAATEVRAIANKRADEAKGRFDQADQQLAALRKSAPAVRNRDEIQAAKDLIAASLAWDKYDAQESARASIAAAEAAREDWKRRRAELGEPPPYNEGEELKANQANRAALEEENAARKARDVAIQAIGVAENAVTVAEQASDSDLEQATRKVAELEGKVASHLAAGDACPTCARPGWPKAQEQLEIARTALGSAKAFEASLRESASERKARRVAAAQAKVDEARAKADAAKAAHEAATAKAKAAGDAFIAARGRKEKLSEHNRALAALGPEPTIPSIGNTTKPDAPKPSAEQVVQARATIDDAQKAEGAAAQHARATASAEQAATAAEASHKAAEAERFRMNVLVDAVRKAPTVIAERQIAALGDLGPVSLRFVGNGVEVLVDGLPWEFASDGRCVVADLHFRAALRRAVKLGWLPLFVDSVQAVGGQPVPDVGGPVVHLRTTDGDLVSSAAKKAAA